MVHVPLQYTGELFIIWYETFFGKWEAKLLRPHYIILYNKIKPRMFEVCNRQCFKSRFRMNQDSMGSVDPDPGPSRSKWFLKIGQKQRNVWRGLLEPRMWTSFLLRCKKIPICWFFVKFFSHFCHKNHVLWFRSGSGFALE